MYVICDGRARCPILSCPAAVDDVGGPVRGEVRSCAGVPESKCLQGIAPTGQPEKDNNAVVIV